MTDPTTAAAPAQVVCRLLQPDDAHGVARLWQSETPWGEPPRELVDWFSRNPTPGSFVAVAVDERGAIVGQIVMMATRLSVDGREVRAIHQFAPIAARTTRERSDRREHPVTKLIRFAFQEARARSFSLVYSMPDPRWMGLFRRIPGLQVGKFPLWSLPLPLERFIPLADGYSMVRLETFDQRVDRLWSAAAQRPGCQLVRDARALQWRLGSSMFEVLAVERSGELVAIVAARQKEMQWTVCDLVSADDEARAAALTAVCNAAHAHAMVPHQKFSLRKVALLTTASDEAHARRLGFSPDAYEYLLLAAPLDGAIGGDAVAADRWYLTDNE